MQRAMIIVNPSSGKEQAGEYVEQIEEVLWSNGYQVNTFETAQELDATKFCQEACLEKYDVVVSMGGDGTLNETINGMAGQEHRPTLGIIPMGTMNDIARALHIPFEPEAAIELLQGHRTKKIDLGKVNDHYFMNIVASGAIAQATSQVTVEQKTKLGPFAYFAEGVKAFTKRDLYDFNIQYDDGEWVGEAWHFIAVLTNSVGGFEELSPDAEVNDGKLHCFVIKNITVANVPLLAAALVRGELKNQKDVDYFTTSSVKISSTNDLVANVDGEIGDRMPLTLDVLPRRIEVFVP
ncbi:diacylglycerol kinase family lipid kinase [Bacillus tianshenii]|nr:diacylglycerol kinase family lipid kinase [Bacillus tianshenii]